MVAKFPGATMEYKATEQYRNMKEVLDQYPQVVAYAEEAIQRAGLTVKKESIRGGTDGSRFSYIGMPCPEYFYRYAKYTQQTGMDRYKGYGKGCRNDCAFEHDMGGEELVILSEVEGC